MVKELQDEFGLGDEIRFELDQHGMERAILRSPYSEAIVYLNGAHVTHFQLFGQPPLLFLSSKSNFIPGKAIRGGVPIIYPWFGKFKDDPTAPMHGFARTSQWRIQSRILDDGVVGLRLLLDSYLHFTLRVGSSLEMQLQVRNDAFCPVTFEEALHSYLAVSDARNISITGLAGKTFMDKTDNMIRKQQSHDPLQINSETDRVYLNTPDTVTLDDPPWNRRITVEKSNSSTTVIWNPWKEMPDLRYNDWTQFVCIETANAADNAITLPRGGSHSMSASIYSSMIK